jgi:hypothetical protein
MMSGGTLVRITGAILVTAFLSAVAREGYRFDGSISRPVLEAVSALSC